MSDTIQGRRLLIGCEGNFQYNNASITAYGLETGEVVQRVYEIENDASIGDILQSIYRKGDSLFVVMNNSGLIRILADSSLKQIGMIEGLSSPRHVHFIGSNLMLVSDLFSQLISVVDLKSLQIIRTVPVGQWAEMFGVAGGKVIIAGMGDSVLLRLNEQHSSIDSIISLEMAPERIISSKDSLLIAGNTEYGSKLAWLTPKMEVVYTELSFTINGLAIQGNYVYILGKSRVFVYNLQLVLIGGWRHDASTPYALFANEDGVFISDVKDYISKGEVLYFGHDQELIDRIECGYIPQSMISL
ncbi:MAG: hypothetical protein HQ500_05395 [Flavobacteriales bacterium]|nr:hypothetical protein [Flavobacteriales bacterium]